MGFADARARLVDALFAHLGEDATWEGVADPVRVITRDEDQQFGGEIEIIGQTLVFRVRRSEVAEPQEGQLVTTTADSAQYRVLAEAKKDRRGVWHVPMEEL